MFFTVSETSVLRAAFYLLLLLLTLLSSGPTLAADCKTPEECKAQLQNDSISIGLRLHWQPAGDITLNNNNRLVFPIFELVSGLYRFEMHRQQVFVYIGETENLKRRFAEYRAPNKTNKSQPSLSALSFYAHSAPAAAHRSLLSQTRPRCALMVAALPPFWGSEITESCLNNSPYSRCLPAFKY